MKLGIEGFEYQDLADPKRQIPVGTTAEHPFWMHNTLISLDMIHLGEDRAVVGVIAHAPPQTDTSRVLGKPSRYVVEVGAGEAAVHGVGPGTRAVFIDVPE